MSAPRVPRPARPPLDDRSRLVQMSERIAGIEGLVHRLLADRLNDRERIAVLENRVMELQQGGRS